MHMYVYMLCCCAAIIVRYLPTSLSVYPYGAMANTTRAYCAPRKPERTGAQQKQGATLKMRALGPPMGAM